MLYGIIPVNAHC